MVADLLAEGLPDMPGPSEALLRERAEILAMAVVATVLNGDTAAQKVFLDDLFALNLDGAGVILAIEHLTTIRLDGIPPAGLSPRAVVSLDLAAAPVDGTEQEQRRYLAALETVTHIWTGKATGNTARLTHGMTRLIGSGPEDIRALLIIMARDIAARIERFTGWRNDGYDHWEDYRNAHPLPNTVPPPAES
jgi:hypothetical protein